MLEIKLDEQQAYPPFITSGKNVFELKMYDNNWKIIDHSYPGLNAFEISTDNKLPELDLESLKKQIDTEFK